MSDQERFDELFKKGYKNLDATTRVEYSALKEKLEKPKEVVNGKPVFSEDAQALPEKDKEFVRAHEERMAKEPAQSIDPAYNDRIGRLERMVENLSNENTSLRQETSKLQEGWAEYKPPKDRNKTATLKVYREDADSPAGVITKLSTFKNNAFDEETRKRDRLIFSLTVTYDDGEEKELKMDAKDFAEMKEVEEVEIVKEERRKLRKVEGFINRPEMDKDDYPRRILSGGSGYGTNIGSAKVPLEIFRVESTVTVKRSNGQEISDLSNDILNI